MNNPHILFQREIHHLFWTYAKDIQVNYYQYTVPEYEEKRASLKRIQECIEKMYNSTPIEKRTSQLLQDVMDCKTRITDEINLIPRILNIERDKVSTVFKDYNSYRITINLTPIISFGSSSSEDYILPINVK